MNQSCEIVKTQQGQYSLYALDDGFDYTAMWQSFMQGNRDGVTTLRIEDVREVYLIETQGRKLILKIDSYVPDRFEKKLRFIAFSPYFSKQMRQVRNAIKKGCRLVPDLFFVAEKKEGIVITQSVIVQEYIEGEHFFDMQAALDNEKALVAAVKELHSFGLVHCDLNLDNIFITSEGIRFIDLSSTGTRIGGLGKDIMRLRDYFGIRMPLTSPLEKTAYYYTTAKFILQNVISGKRRTG